MNTSSARRSTTQQQTIHHILAKSYLSFFMASLIGLLIDSLFITLHFGVPYARTIALICFGLGPLLILWAQVTSGTSLAHSATPHGYFMSGPYHFVRNPTQLGLLILVTGYTLVSGSVVFFGITLIGYLVSNIFFTKYESLIATHYPGEYHTYRSRTPKI